MGFLGELFDDAVDIVAAPVKIVTKITDEAIDSDFTEIVNAVKDEIKNEQIKRTSRKSRII